MRIFITGQFLVALALTFALIGYLIATGTADAVERQPHDAMAAAGAATPAAPAGTEAPLEFQPPAESSLADDEFGKVVRQGKEIFTHTDTALPQYVGNNLKCSNCHLDAGTKANAAPMWAAYGLYPAYRKKNGHVNTFTERLQECFRYSMNGRMPPAGDPGLVALESYAYWLAKGAPTGMKLKGQGLPKLNQPALPPDYARGEAVYRAHCSACHKADGSGGALGQMAVPPLWGSDSYNWGAGMHQVDNAAGFIKANMPLGQGNSLSDQDAWDVALYIDSHERPQDPRFSGSVAQTRQLYHDGPNSMYGRSVNGHVLGSGSVPAGGRLAASTAPGAAQ